MNIQSPFQTKTWISALLWGSSWALSELTLGHLLHLFGFPGLAGFIMFPIGATMMIRVFKETGSRPAVFGAAALAAGLKLLDLFLPAPNLFTVINPALAILSEGLVVSGLVIPMSTGRRRLRRLAVFGAASLVWRPLYAGILLILGFFLSIPSVLDLGQKQLLLFFFLESLGNIIFFIPPLLLSGRMDQAPPKRLAPMAAMMFAAAAAAQIFF